MGNKNVKLSTIAHPTPIALAVLACLVTVPATGLAAPCPAPPAICLSNDGFDWRTDRFTPDNVEMLPSHQGGTNVTHIQMGPNGFFTAPARAGFQTRFYDTQGVSAVTNLPVGPAFLSGSVFISSAMQAAQTATLDNTHDKGNFVRFGLWGEAFGPAHPPAFPIITFTNINGPGRIEIFDSATGFVPVEAQINYDGWNRLEVRFKGNSYEFLLNGAVIHTLTGQSANALTDQLRTAFLNSSNNNTSAYDVYWDNILAGIVTPAGGPLPAFVTTNVVLEGGTTAVQQNTTINGSLITDAGSTVTVGSGVTLAVTGMLIAAHDSTLTIGSGGIVQSAGGTIGMGGTSTATATGAGSAWNSSANITVGSSDGVSPGNGTLTIADNATVSVNAGSGTVTLATAPQGSLGPVAGAATTGTLNIGSGAAPGILNAAEVTSGIGVATVNFNHSQAPYYFTKDGTAGGAAVLISGAAVVNHTGPGTTVFTGNNTYTGPTTISAGILQIDGQQPNSAVTVSNTGKLAGNGGVGATTVNSGAKVAPGASIGTLTVNGNYTQNAGSVYEVEVDPNTDQSDRIVVNGAATVASGAAIAVSKVNPSAYRVGTRYTVLTTTGGLTGTYALTGDLTLSALESLVSAYDANNAYLLVASTDLSALATTPNQKAIAAALQSLPAGSALVGAIAALPDPASAEAAFDALSGEMHASVKTVLLDDSRYVRETANDRMRQAFCAGAVGNVGITAQQQEGGGACRPDRRGAWGRLFGVTGEMDGDSNVARLHHSSSGVLVGADAPVADTWRAGVLAGYQQSHFDQDPRGSSGSGDNYNLGVYGGSQWGPISLSLGTAYTWSSIETRRSVNVTGASGNLRKDYDANTFQIFGELGYAVQAGEAYLEPFVGLAYVDVHTDSFTEDGGGAALSAQSDSDSTTLSTLGVRASSAPFKLGALSATANGTLAWQHAFGDPSPTSTLSFAGGGAPFTVQGAPVARNAALVEAGLTALLRSDLRLGVFYTGQFGDGATYQGARANLHWTF